MATWTKKQIMERAREIIPQHNLIFVEDVCAMVGISKTSFYEKIRIDSDEMNELKELINKNRIDTRVSLRKKWNESDNATLQMALYKLTSTKEEHRKLSQNYSEQTASVKVAQTLPDLSNLSQKEIDQLERLLKKAQK